MTEDPPVKPREIRGSHAERSATMRQRLVEAAVTCLHTLGYAATTTQQVMETAQVSRGAMLHHFPTKVDLMIAVAEHASDNQDRVVRKHLGRVPEGIDRYLALTSATWEAMSHPAALALIEILMASRSDPALAQRLPSVMATTEARQREGVWQLAQEIGIRDRKTVEVMVRLHTAAMRGLAIDLVLSKNQVEADECMGLLRKYKRVVTGALVTKSWEPEPS